MLPLALAAALALPPSETAWRYTVRAQAREFTGVELLAEKLRVEAVDLRDVKKPSEALPLCNAAVRLCSTDGTRIGRAKTFAALGRYDDQADEYAWVFALPKYHSFTTRPTTRSRCRRLNSSSVWPQLAARHTDPPPTEMLLAPASTLNVLSRPVGGLPPVTYAFTVVSGPLASTSLCPSRFTSATPTRTTPV
jgi:hypothetical protein